MKKTVALIAVAILLAVGGIGACLLVPPDGGRTVDSGKAEAGSEAGQDPVGQDRPGTWAQPLELPGCSNLHKVSESLYRGAQPTPEGMKELKRLGVRTIVNLRSFHSDRDEIAASGAKFAKYEHIYMKAWHAEDKEVVKFLQIMSDPANHPVFVHCQHGADRTGTMCAFYRIALQGWSKKEAMREMRYGGYGFHGVWQNLLRYIDGSDIEEIKKRAGIAVAAP